MPGAIPSVDGIDVLVLVEIPLGPIDADASALGIDAPPMPPMSLSDGELPPV
jgi:hypothetical protein